MPVPTVLGLDSALKTGWGLVQGDTLLEKGVVDASELRRVDTLAAFVCARTRPDLVLIEDNFFHKNMLTLKVLSRIVGAWQLAFAVRGVTTALITPAEWQHGILAGLLGKKAHSAEIKDACMRWVNLTYKVKLGSDASDGIAIATFGARRMAQEARIRRATSGSIPRRAI